ncbi:MAG: GNAT family N-acetyltransferase [Saprospiraceae bacterium]|nr:GNAT family N-acetyltransferase [Saprospiraceae bacterium]
MFFIESERLKLLALEHHQLLLLLENQLLLEQSLGLNPTNLEVHFGDNFMKEFEEAMQAVTIPMVAQHPEHYKWLTFWLIVHKKDNLYMGGIGAFGFPVKHESETMVGYFIDQKYEGQGFATEALACLLEWMLCEPALKTVVADTPAAHFASQKVLQKNGFVYDKEVEEGIRWRLMR